MGTQPLRLTIVSCDRVNGSLDSKTESALAAIGSKTDSKCVREDTTMAPSSPGATEAADSSRRRNSIWLVIVDMSLIFFYMSLNASINSAERPNLRDFPNFAVLHRMRGSIHDRSLILFEVLTPADAPDSCTSA